MFDCGEDHSVVEQNPYVVKNTKQRCIEYLERAETIKKKLSIHLVSCKPQVRSPNPSWRIPTKIPTRSCDDNSSA